MKIITIEKIQSSILLGVITGIIAVIIFTGCGIEQGTEQGADQSGNLSSAQAGQMASELKGTWLSGSLADGAVNPVATGCTSADGHSHSTELTIADALITTTKTHFIGATDCTGANTITISEATAFVNGDDNGSAVLVPTSHSKTLVVATATAAQALNGSSACGKTDWAAQAYATDAPQLTGCDDDNSGAFMTRHVEEETMQAIVLRLERQGTGLRYQLRPADIPGADYSAASYFAVKP